MKHTQVISVENVDTKKKDLGCVKIYNCEKCKTKIERDVNGARNILLKHLVLD